MATSGMTCAKAMMLCVARCLWCECALIFRTTADRPGEAHGGRSKTSKTMRPWAGTMASGAYAEVGRGGVWLLLGIGLLIPRRRRREVALALIAT